MMNYNEVWGEIWGTKVKVGQLLKELIEITEKFNAKAPKILHKLEGGAS